ncbi:MAG: energy-coupling factor transporter transmembrane protein EcfT [Nocardia sp.]|nr:energy-coupling factor transporter transmembrane protein EcfT [Nocardia sp.]
MSTVLLREVPVDSPVHRLWAGTKLIAVFIISLLLMVYPTWPVLGVIVVFLIATGVAARLPLGTVPLLPWWFWGLVLLTGVLTVPSGGAAVIRYLQTLLFTLVLLAASFMIAWTTPMGEIAPAIARLGAPLRVLRFPVDEWAVVVALTLRGLPLLMDEIRILWAARRLRPKDRSLPIGERNPLVDILTAVMAVSTRRAGELGQAITARGGTGQLTAHPDAPGRADAIALAVVVGVCAGSVVLSMVLYSL